MKHLKAARLDPFEVEPVSIPVKLDDQGCALNIEVIRVANSAMNRQYQSRCRRIGRKEARYLGGIERLKFEGGNKVSPAAIEAGPNLGGAGAAQVQRLERTTMQRTSRILSIVIASFFDTEPLYIASFDLLPFILLVFFIHRG